jgi:hypothetical protein
MSFFTLVLSALFAITSLVGRDFGTYTTITSLEQIPWEQPAGTLFLFDIDDTIFDSPHLVGSKVWRKYIAEATESLDPTQNWHDIFSYGLALRYPLQLVEKNTSTLIRELQNSGYVVCGFTSRERNKWYDMPQPGVDFLTIGQLRGLDVDFYTQTLEKSYPHLSQAPEYFLGVFFANIEPKGEYLLHLLQDAPQLPPKIVFIDDKLTQVVSVASALESLGISYECYHYTATDAKGQTFDPLIANIQLHSFFASDGKTVLSDSQAAEIAEEHPAKEADFYLRAILSLR